MLVPLRELLSWERHTNFKITLLEISVTQTFVRLSWCKCVSVPINSYQLKQRVSYRVAFILPRPRFLSRLVLGVAGWFLNPASTSSSPSSSSSPAAGLIIRAPGPSSWLPGSRWGVVCPGPAVEQVIPGTGAGMLHASSWPGVTLCVQGVLAAAPGHAPRSGGWGVTPTWYASLIAAAEATAAALARAGGASLGCRGWHSARLPYWWKCDDATLWWAIIKGRDHAGRAGGKWDIHGNVLGRRWHVLHVLVWGWRWLGLMGSRNQKKLKTRSKHTEQKKHKWNTALYHTVPMGMIQSELYSFLQKFIALISAAANIYRHLLTN